MLQRRIAIVWELGHGSSYLNFIRALAQVILGAGHQCVVISRDLSMAINFLGHLDIELRASPSGSIITADALPIQTSYSSLLFHNGFHNRDAIAERLLDWVSLLRDLELNLIIARHSPTALLASRCVGIPAVHYGNSFSVPPPISPWPSFRPDLVVSPETLSLNDARVLERVNAALRHLNFKELETLQQIHSTLPTILLDYPELDPYGWQRAGAPGQVHYLGFPDLNFGAAPVWSNERPVKVFLSLLPSSSMAWAGQLIRCGADVLLRVRGTKADLPATMKETGITLADGASLNFREAIVQADVVVGYGSHNLVCEALLAGKAVAVITHSADELILGQRVMALGVGCRLPSIPDRDAQTLLQKFIWDKAIQRNARAFSGRYLEASRHDIPSRFLELSLRI